MNFIPICADKFLANEYKKYYYFCIVINQNIVTPLHRMKYLASDLQLMAMSSRPPSVVGKLAGDDIKAIRGHWGEGAREKLLT